MSPRVVESILAVTADAPAERVEPMHRLLGGAGLLVAVTLLLAVPVVIALRAAARRRRDVRPVEPKGPAVDAWAESARRVREGA